jgi:hypothetical protein
MLAYQNVLAGTMAPTAVAQPNVLASVLRPQQTQTTQTTGEQPKRKRSFAEVAGRIGDVLAIMGGREPIYDAYARRQLADEQAAAAREGLAGFASGPQTPQDVARLISMGVSPTEINAVRSAGGAGGVDKDLNGFLAQTALQVARLPIDQQAQAWANITRQGETLGFRGASAIPFSPETLQAAIAGGGQATNLFANTGVENVVLPPDSTIGARDRATGLYTPETLGALGATAPAPAPAPRQQTPAPVLTVPRDTFEADATSLGLKGAIRYAASKGLAVPIRNDEEFALLPSGAAFIGPDGVPRRKP